MNKKQNQHTVRYDSYPVKSIKLDDDGMMRGAALVTKTGVFPYPNDDGSIRYELRHPDDVFSPESMNSLKLRPVTNQHPPLSGNPPTRLVTPENISKLSIGTTGENPTREEGYLATTIVINNISGVKAVQSGVQQLSCGYNCDTSEESGFFEGVKYTHRQSNIRYNHVSIVQKGRAGNDVRLNLDSLDYFENDNETGAKSMSTETMESIRIDGISYKADPEVMNKVKSVEKEIKSLEVKCDGLESQLKESTSELEKTKAQRDDVQEKLAKAEKIDHVEEIKKQAKELAKVISVAKEIVSEEVKLDELDSMGVMKAVVASKFPELALEEKSEEYIQARFDAVCEDMKAAGSKSIADQRKAVASREDSVEKLSPRDKYIQSLNKKDKSKGDK